MILVTCTTCGVVFDLEFAEWCNEYVHSQHSIAAGQGKTPGEKCKVCPLGHAGHDSQTWWEAKRRPATGLEKDAGFDFMLPDFDVPGGFKP